MAIMICPSSFRILGTILSIQLKIHGKTYIDISWSFKKNNTSIQNRKRI